MLGSSAAPSRLPRKGAARWRLGRAQVHCLESVTGPMSNRHVSKTTIIFGMPINLASADGTHTHVKQNVSVIQESCMFEAPTLH